MTNKGYTIYCPFCHNILEIEVLGMFDEQPFNEIIWDCKLCRSLFRIHIIEKEGIRKEDFIIKEK
jgi:hypothetical protein